MSSLRLLVLRHPRDARRAMTSAPIVAREVPECVLTCGLSWPNLRGALGEPADWRRWAVLGLPSKTVLRDVRKAVRARVHRDDGALSDVAVLDRRGHLLAVNERPDDLDGLIVLDGSWPESRSLYWRNPWLAKLRRIVVFPGFRSAFGRLKRQPHRDCIATAEAVACVLERFGDDPHVPARLIESFGAMVADGSESRTPRNE